MDDGEDGEGPDVDEAEAADDITFEEIADLDAELEVLDVIERSGGVTVEVVLQLPSTGAGGEAASAAPRCATSWARRRRRPCAPR